MPLTDCFIDVFAFVIQVVKEVELEQPRYEQVRETVERLLAASDSCVTGGSFSREDYDEARFALCAWVDELLLSSGWEERDSWLREQLQRRHYQTTAAGEEFFDRLDRIGPERREVREVYFLCLALGFTGRFCKPESQHELQELKKENLKLLIGSSGETSLDRPLLFPEAFPCTDGCQTLKKRRPSLPWPTAVALGFPLLLFGILFIMYRIILSGVGESLLLTLGN